MSAEPAVEHVAGLPPPPLRPYASSMVGYRMSGLPSGIHLGMPSATVTLVISLDRPLTVTPDTGAPAELAACVGGPHTRAVAVHHDGTQHGIQVDLTPAGCRALLGVPAGEVASACLELGDVIGGRAQRLRDAVHEEAEWERRFALVVVTLSRTRAARPVDDRLDRTWRRIAATAGSVRVADLASATGWSTRQLTERFTREYGMGPKTACRLSRFGRAHRLLQAGRPGAEVAARCGYADQPHFVRDWREFTGTTPTGWVASDDLAFVQDRVGACSA